MLVFRMFYQLILSIVADTTYFTLVRFLICVASLVIVPVPNCSESFNTVLTFVRFFAGVYSHVDKKIASFVEQFLAEAALKINNRLIRA